MRSATGSNPIDKRCPLPRILRTLVPAGVLWLAPAVSIHAQEDRPRHGVWWGLGIGYGLASVSCDTCSFGALSGFSIFGDLGVTVSPHVRVGVEGDFWANGLRKGPLPTIDTWTVFLSYYPRIRGGPYVHAGLGLSHYGLEHGTGDPLESVSSSEPAYAAAMGWGYTFGAGWDLPGTRGSGIARVTYAYGDVGTLHTTGTTGWKQHLVLLEVGGALP